MAATEADFVECTTRSAIRRHWSEIPAVQWGLRTLCGTRGHSQAVVDVAMPSGWRKRKVIADLPVCAQCEKSRQRRIEGRPS